MECTDTLNDFPLLNKSETPVRPKSNNLTKSPKHSKTQIDDKKIAPEEETIILENLRAEMIA